MVLASQFKDSLYFQTFYYSNLLNIVVGQWQTLAKDQVIKTPLIC